MRKNSLINITSLVMLIILSTWVLPVNAASTDSSSADSETITYTLEEAISDALSKSDSLYSIELDSDIADEQLDDALDNWNPAWITDWVEGTESNYEALLNARYNVKVASKKEEMERDSVTADTRSKYYSVLQSIRTLEQTEAELEVAQIEADIALAKYQHGLLTWNEVQEANLSLASAQTNLVEAENDLSSDYRAFNRQVGIDVDARPILTDEPIFNEFQTTNVNASISAIISSDPEIWITSQKLKVQEKASAYSGSTEEAELTEEQSKISARLEKTNITDTLYDAYYSIVSLEKGYAVEQSNLELAQKTLEQTELKVALGIATNLDLLNAQLTLLSQENTIFSLVCQHELLKTEFEQPWI